LPVSSFSMILIWLIFYIKAAPGYNLLSYPMSYRSALRAVDLCHHVLGLVHCLAVMFASVITRLL
jgi:hypothetical protein